MHGASSQVPLRAIVACGAVAGVVWFGIDYLTPDPPTQQQYNELDQAILESKQQLDQAQRMMEEAQKAFQMQK